MSELVLPRRARPQPVPHLNPGGDCGPCVLAGLLGWDVHQVYGRLHEGKVESLSYYELQRILRGHPELFDRCIDEFPVGWSTHEAHRAFGSLAHLQALDWWRYVRMALEAGYYGIANVDFRRGGPTGQGADHWILICGGRERGPAPGETGRWWNEVLISCSAKSSPDEEWVEAEQFLRERGGFNVLLARPR